MRRTQGSLVRKAVFAGLVSIGLATSAFAQTAVPTTGLGQSWPNAADLSASPNWHVYVFSLNGVKYIQINDLNGTVHAAVAAIDGVAMTLPMGVDAQNVRTSASSASSTTQPAATHTQVCDPLNCNSVTTGVQDVQAAASTTSTAQTVYSDATTTVTAAPQSNGATQFSVEQSKCNPVSCSAVTGSASN